MDNSPPDMVMPDTAGLAAAAACLRGHAVVAVPTETVYGLAARADSDAAVAAIYRAKGRPDFNPLIVHVADVAAAERLAVFDARALDLAGAFWPGPLTLVLPRRAGAPLATAVSAGLPTLALRCPAHPVMRALLALVDFPLAAPSANRSGGVSPTTAAHVAASLGAAAGMILDGGACAGGIESTIVVLREGNGWKVLRPGPITAGQIANVLGTPPVANAATSIEAPGQLASHYAPGKPIRLNASHAAPNEFLIGFGPQQGDFNLSPAGDLVEAASHLYAALHTAAAAPHARIAVAPLPAEGIGAAIKDRLSRAAT